MTATRQTGFRIALAIAALCFCVASASAVERYRFPSGRQTRVTGRLSDSWETQKLTKYRSQRVSPYALNRGAYMPNYSRPKYAGYTRGTNLGGEVRHVTGPAREVRDFKSAAAPQRR